MTLRAVKEIITDNRSCRSIAPAYRITPTTLRRYCVMHRSVPDDGEVSTCRVGYFNHRQAFSPTQENFLMD